MLDLYLLYQFLRRLATPFEEWDAYDLGIIDKNGKILKRRRSLKKREEKKAFGVYDVMILNIKKLIQKAPGGDRRLASYAAALYLLREWKHFTPETMLNESISDEEIYESVAAIDSLAGYLKEDTSIIPEARNDVKQKNDDLNNFFEEVFGEEAPTNSASSGAVAGIGVGPDGEPGITIGQSKRYKKRNKKNNGKRLRDIIGSPEFEKSVPRKMKEDREKESDDPCWDDYVQIGIKKKNGKNVPNCVSKKKYREE